VQFQFLNSWYKPYSVVPCRFPNRFPPLGGLSFVPDSSKCDTAWDFQQVISESRLEPGSEARAGDASGGRDSQKLERTHELELKLGLNSSFSVLQTQADSLIPTFRQGGWPRGAVVSLLKV
jgi:hypothetical protein